MSGPPPAGLAAMQTHALDVPGARLYYDQRGTGPLLVMIGSPMDSTGFAGLADAMADRYTVVTYDPRGIGSSTREDTSHEVTPGQQAEDVRRILAGLGGGPVLVFGSSGGAVVGLELVRAHPGQVVTLVAHEPPVIDLLPDRDQVQADIQDIYNTYRAQGPEKAMAKFMAHAGLARGAGPAEGARSWKPDRERIARTRATTDVFLSSLIRATTRYQPDIEALRSAPARIVVGVGAASAGQLAHRSALALADKLGTPAVEFPGDHGGFVGAPGPFSQVLNQVLTQPA